MQSYVVIPGPAVFVPVADGDSPTVTNLGPNTVYYGNSPAVTDSAASGSIASGASAMVTGQYFAVAAGGRASLAVSVTPLGAFDRATVARALTLLPTGDTGAAPTVPHVWQNFSHLEIASGTIAANASGTMDVWPLWMPMGLSFTRIGVLLGTVAWTSSTNSFLALYDNAQNLIIQTPDHLTTVGAVSTVYDRPLTGGVTYTTTREGLYYLGMSTAASASPSYGGRNTAVTAIVPWVRARTSSTGLAGVAPSSFTASSSQTGQPYICFK